MFDRLSVDVEDAGTAFAQSVRLMLRLCRSRPQISAVLVRDGMQANPELVDDAACDQLVEQLLRMLGVPFDAARELAHAPLPVAKLYEPADLRDPSAHTGPQPTLARLRPPPSSPFDPCPRCSALVTSQRAT